MDRIELDEELELDTTKALKPLFGSNKPVYQKKVAKGIYNANQALGTRIWPLLEPYTQTLDRPFTLVSLLGIIKRKGPKFVEWCYTEVKESHELGKAQNPLKLFLWKIKQVPVPLTDQ